jgi:hypothetical protein
VTTRIPEGMTDPDAIDAWLEERDTREYRAARDAAVMAATPPGRNPDAVTDPTTKAAIEARLNYLRLPFWRRWFTPRPDGLVDRHPTGLLNH